LNRIGFFFRAMLPGLLFISTGIMHFTAAPGFRAIVPPQLGHADVLVAISGVAEICGGLGLLIPFTRRAAAIGLIALLIAVWPANIYMAIAAKDFASVAPAWLIWARVPLQLLLIWWVIAALRAPSVSSRAESRDRRSPQR
jgi:uncharacterized membrane protein